MAEIAVVGVGAIGGVLASLLQTTGRHGLTLCTRRPLRDLTVHTPDGAVGVEAMNLVDPGQAVPVDWVMVATKTYDAEGAKRWLEHLVGAKTKVAVVQNGVEHRENFAPEWKVLPVIIDVPTERREDGSVLQRSKAVMKVEKSAAGQEFRELFAGSKAEVEEVEDFLTAAWAKLCINAAGAVSALTGKPAGVLRDQELGRVAMDLVAECVAVGRAEGAKLEEGLPEKVLAGARAGSPDSVNSLLADRLAGRPMEVAARNGVIVQMGEKHGIATPANRMAAALLKALVQ